MSDCFHFSGRVRTIAKTGYQFRHFCLPVRMEQLGSHWADIQGG